MQHVDGERHRAPGNDEPGQGHDDKARDLIEGKAIDPKGEASSASDTKWRPI